jgi:hypothetical protein
VWRTLPQHIDLMPQYQDFGFKPPSRLEAIAQHADEKEANCNHQPQSCSDSVTAATPADGLFGSDRGGWDRDILVAELGDLAKSLPELDWDLSITGFEPAEIERPFCRSGL